MSANDASLPYLGSTHRQISDAIASSLRRRDSLIVVTGESGIGKTTLCRFAIERAENAATCTIVNPFLTFRDFLKQVVSDFGVSVVQSTEDDFELVGSEHDLIQSIQQFLASNPDRLAIVFIDDAHVLNPVVLGQLRALLNLGEPGRALTIVLAGQSKFEETLTQPRFVSVKERVVQWHRLEPLTRAEVAEYLACRYGAHVRLTPPVLEKLTALSGGVPAAINQFFDTARALASARKVEEIDVPTLREAAAALRTSRDVTARHAAAPLRTVIAVAFALAIGWVAGRLWPSDVRPGAPVSTVPALAPATQVSPSPATEVSPLPVTPKASPPPTERVTPAPAAPPAATERITPTPPAAASPSELKAAPNVATKRESAVRGEPDIDRAYQGLRETVERRFNQLAMQGKVKELLALRAETIRRDKQLGSARPEIVAKLLTDIDAKTDEARAVRLRLDADAFRRQ